MIANKDKPYLNPMMRDGKYDFNFLVQPSVLEQCAADGRVPYQGGSRGDDFVIVNMIAGKKAGTAK
jgi:hypothetical protein